MPKVFEKLGFSFRFYANDHKPIHVHIMKAGKEAIFEVSEDKVSLRDNYGMNLKELKIIQQITLENRELIIKVWTDFFKQK